MKGVKGTIIQHTITTNNSWELGKNEEPGRWLVITHSYRLGVQLRVTHEGRQPPTEEADIDF